MRIAYIGHSQAKPDKVDAFREFLTSVVAPGVTSSAGCESYQLYQSESDPTQFVGIEIWTSVEAHRGAVINISPESIAEFRQLVAAPPTGGYYRLV
jgi:quinol monooxygenase YgiN